MLNTEISKAVDLHWDACWPTNKLNPLIIVDLITYLFYVKQLDDLEPGKQNRADRTFFSEQEEELRWSSFSKLDADKMQKLFVKEGGVIEWVNRYAMGNHQFSKLLHTPLLMVPTPKLLAHAVAILNIMNEHDLPTQSLIYKQLIDKAFLIDNRLINIPGEVIQLLVSLLNPKRGDLVLDALAGTGNSLIHSSKFIGRDSEEGDYDSNGKIFTGIEPDPVLYRMAALNLFLAATDDALLKTSKDYKDADHKPTLVVGNLLFHTIPVDSSTEVITSEHLFNFIENSLQAGGRAGVLLSNAENIVHKALLEKHTLEAVISLPKEFLKNYDQAKVNLLLFTKAFPKVHPPVWFYEASVTDLRTNESEAGESLPFAQLLHQWQNLEEQRTLEPTEKSFFVPVDQIRKYNYDLNIARYQYAIERSREEAPKEIRKKKSGIVVIPPPKSINTPAPVASTIKKQVPARPTTTNPVRPPVKQNRYGVVVLSLLAAFLFGAAALYFATSITPNRTDNAPDKTIVKKNDIDEPLVKAQPQSETEKHSGTFRNVENVEKVKPEKAEVEKVTRQSASLPETEPQQKEKALVKTTVTSTEDKEQLVLQTGTSENEAKGLYKIIDKAYFHNDPDESTRREAFVVHWNNSYATIKALEEKNEFVYTVFKNHLGQTSKGWLRKKDLRPIED